MDSSTILTILIICVVVFSIFAYLFFMVFFPEWVGITGKKAKEIQASHVGDESETTKPNEPAKNQSENQPEKK